MPAFERTGNLHLSGPALIELKDIIVSHFDWNDLIELSLLIDEKLSALVPANLNANDTTIALLEALDKRGKLVDFLLQAWKRRPKVPSIFEALSKYSPTVIEGTSASSRDVAVVAVDRRPKIQAPQQATIDKPQAAAERIEGGHLFVCFSSKDKSEALSLVEELEKRGLQCWISTRDVRFQYQHEIVEAIRIARAIIVVFSHNANSSREMLKEIALASRYNVRMIPVRIENVEPTKAFEYELSTSQYVDLFEGCDPGIVKIVKLVRLIVHAE